jgi:hypothetical protein
MIFRVNLLRPLSGNNNHHVCINLAAHVVITFLQKLTDLSVFANQELHYNMHHLDDDVTSSYKY